MTKRDILRRMCGEGFDRQLVTDPPTPEYRQIGWHCVYHEQAGRSCHNPLDCDLVPIWALSVEAFHTHVQLALDEKVSGS